MSLKLVSSSKCWDGEQRIYSHQSSTLNCEMKFGIYLPPAALSEAAKCPVLYFLSGLTCTHESFIHKSGMQQYASKYGLIVVNPDTSPRNVNIPGEDDAYDFGSGAGFYVNAIVEPWSKNYQMFNYVTKELIELIDKNFSILLSNKKGIFGHSMGGHGALICALKNPDLYQAVSAFAPVSNPMECPWGQKAFKGYLGDDRALWKEWDATQLAITYTGPQLEVFIDQGARDDFLKQQLLPDNFIEQAEKNNQLKIVYILRDGYDHSYYYIMSFIGEHFAYHAKMLK